MAQFALLIQTFRTVYYVLNLLCIHKRDWVRKATLRSQPQLRAREHWRNPVTNAFKLRLKMAGVLQPVHSVAGRRGDLKLEARETSPHAHIQPNSHTQVTSIPNMVKTRSMTAVRVQALTTYGLSFTFSEFECAETFSRLATSSTSITGT